jgi:hypothetical protein
MHSPAYVSPLPCRLFGLEAGHGGKQRRLTDRRSGHQVLPGRPLCQGLSQPVLPSPSPQSTHTHPRAPTLTCHHHHTQLRAHKHTRTVSNDTRVRMEGLVKIMARLLPAQEQGGAGGTVRACRKVCCGQPHTPNSQRAAQGATRHQRSAALFRCQRAVAAGCRSRPRLHERCCQGAHRGGARGGQPPPTHRQTA